MFIHVPAGKTYKCSVSGSAPKHVRCEFCETEYVYQLTRVGRGEDHSFLWLNNRGASAWAAYKAQKALQRHLERGVDLVPCPNCGWCQSSMRRAARRDYRLRMLRAAGLLLALLMLFALFGAGLTQPDAGALRISWSVYLAIVGSLALCGFGLLAIRLLLFACYDLNDQDVETRKQMGRSRALLRADYERRAPQETSSIGAAGNSVSPPIHGQGLTPPRRGFRRNIVWIGNLLLVLGWLGGTLYLGQACRVYLVNGTGRAYDLTVAGQRITVPANGCTTVSVAEGNVEVAFLDARAPRPAVFRVETAFWNRMFRRYTFVINPDRSALLETEQVVYTQHPGNQSPRTSVYQFGQPFYQFYHIDFEFRPFPASILLGEYQSPTQWRLGLVTGLSAEYRLKLLLEKVPEPKRMDFCLHVLRIDPEDTVFLHYVGDRLQRSQMLRLLQSRLDDTPLLVDWHRLYQSLMERMHPEQDLRSRYQQLAARLKNDANAVYLLACIEPDWHREMALLVQAAQAEPPCSHAMFALGFHALSAGQFDTAISWLDMARRRTPENPSFQRLYYEALRANGDLERLLKVLDEDGRRPGMAPLLTGEMCWAHGLLGHHEQARKLLASMDSPRDDAAATDRKLDRLFACVRGDVAAYLRVVPPDSAPSFETALLRGDLGQAARLANHVVTPHALLYLAATGSGGADLAAREWAIFVALLRKEGREERRFADLLEGRQPISADLLAHIALDPKIKRVLLAALARRYPAQSGQIIPLARTLDYERDDLALCLRQVMR